MIDLHPFCRTHARDPGLAKPFSHDDRTYATNGIILLRVPRRADVEDGGTKLNIKECFPTPPPTVFRPVKRAKLPAGKHATCKNCGGRGRIHICPNCRCPCGACAGSGKIVIYPDVAAAIGPVPIALKYAHLLLTLPDIEVSEPVGYARILEFRFAGGDGVLATLREHHGEKVVAEL